MGSLYIFPVLAEHEKSLVSELELSQFNDKGPSKLYLNIKCNLHKPNGTYICVEGIFTTKSINHMPIGKRKGKSLIS